MVDVLYPADFVAVKIKNVKLRQILQVFDLFDVVLAEHQYSESWDGMKMRNFLNVVIVEVQKDEVGQ
jgi:hypothetical protein